MSENAKPVDTLRVQDLEAYPVWQYTNREGDDETAVRPVKSVPVSNLANKVVGTRVRLANGAYVWAIIGNIDSKNARSTKHFATLSVDRSGKWFSLSRYFDFDYADNGPQALARFLGLDVDDVFPISYDLQQYANGDSQALCGQFRKEPLERLSRSELITLAVR